MLTPQSPRQLALALPHVESFARADFLEGSPNREAVALINSWPHWPARIMALIGPPGSGKSHLASIWAGQSGARFLSGAAVGQQNPADALATGALVVEDVTPGRLDENAYFHLINMARQDDAFLLLTSRTAPLLWDVQLPDLQSRLRAVPVVSLAAPDDALLHAVLVKLFADRQIAVADGLIAYLTTRMERSFASARSLVHRLDREALRQQRPITRVLAAEVLRAAEPDAAP